MQVELMLYAFDGSPSLDKVSYLCPGIVRGVSCAASAL